MSKPCGYYYAGNSCNEGCKYGRCNKLARQWAESNREYDAAARAIQLFGPVQPKDKALPDFDVVSHAAHAGAATPFKVAPPPHGPPKGIDSTLAERGTRYGEFKDQAVYAQGMAKIAGSSPNWGKMEADQREALSVIFNKIGRILNGDPDYSDSWHDIAGYATLVDKRLKLAGK